MNDNENEWMTVTEVSEKINVPVETVRRYLRQFSLYLKVKKMHKKYLIHDDSLTVLETIRQQYAEGKNAEEIENFLATSGVTMTITVKNDDDESITVHVADELKEIKKALEEQKQFNEMLLKKLDEQNRYIKESLEKRDRQLMESLTQSLEIRQARIEAAITEKETQKGFFSRLFSKKEKEK
ncbi:MerR family transcriptional regulator [Bacillus smithii]|uniref:MerR family transcriptional regulator n=1 Tax=Bacillus smithii TaxID=1479 RepID=UPI002E216F18|nr:MerR family transcriptional regulator [Bacillus smithii]